jgi:hypothetical protein
MGGRSTGETRFLPWAPSLGSTTGNEAGKSRPLLETDTRGGEGRNRTGDTTVFSRVLYQLSYLAAWINGFRVVYTRLWYSCTASAPGFLT